MARFALVEDGVVTTVIVASPEFVAARGLSAVRVRWPEDPPDPDAISTRDCEPGSGFDAAARSFTRSEPGKTWDPKQRRMVDDPTYVAPPPTLEERIAALERNPPPEGATLEERVAALERRA